MQFRSCDSICPASQKRRTRPRALNEPAYLVPFKKAHIDDSSMRTPMAPNGKIFPGSCCILIRPELDRACNAFDSYLARKMDAERGSRLNEQEISLSRQLSRP